MACQEHDDAARLDVEQANIPLGCLCCLVLYAARNELTATLLSGTTLVVDRYAYSGVAYSAAKGTAGMDISWCKGPDQGLPAPDLVIYLRANSAVATARDGFGEERYEKPEFQDKVGKSARGFGTASDDHCIASCALVTVGL